MSKELSTIDTTPESGYLTRANIDIASDFADEMNGLDPSFIRPKIPAAGGIMFEIPNDETGEIDVLKEFSGVILFHHPVQNYYADKYTGGNLPPDCGSLDGITGTGNPGGRCAKCPLNVFGSGENGSKGCKNKHRLYVLREGEIFPLLLTLPTGSIRALSKYIMSVLGKHGKSNSVVTKFSLIKATNTTGIVYSQVKFATVRKLTQEEIPLIANLSKQVETLSKRTAYEMDEDTYTPAYQVDPETGEIIEPLT